jgi:hypothetical protein
MARRRARRGRKRLWLVNGSTRPAANPRRRRKSTTTRKRRKMPEHVRRAGGWKAYMASIRPNGGSMARSNSRKRRRRRSYRRNPVAASNPRRRRRRYRRNPSFSASGLMKQAQDALLAGTWVTIGKAWSRWMRRQIGTGTLAGEPGTATGTALELAAGLGGGMVARAIMRNRSSHIPAFITAGAVQASIESLIEGANVPILSDVLKDTPGNVSGYFRLGAGRPAAGQMAFGVPSNLARGTAGRPPFLARVGA